MKLRWHLAEKLRGRVLGDAWERAYGDLEWQSINPFRSLPWYVLVHDGGDTVGYGVMVRPRAMCAWQLDPEGVTLCLDVRNGGDGVILNGRRLLAARVVSKVCTGIDAFDAARDFCKAMCDDPILPTKPVYGSNNWYYAYGHSSAQAILDEAEYMAKLTQGLENRPYVVIDDGWQQGRYKLDGAFEEVYNGGPWVSNRRFGDMQALAGQMARKGVIPGIWVRLLQDDSADIPDAWRLASGALDPSLPEVVDHVKGIVDEIGRWGYKLLKHDFSTYDITGLWGWQMGHEVTRDGWHFADRSRTTAEIIVDFYRAILEAAARHDMLVLGCNAVGHLGAGLMHLNRVGEDTSGLVWEKTLQNGVNALAFRLPQHGTFFDVDADCMGITAHIDWSLNRQWGELLSKSGTSMFVSVAPGTLSEDQEDALRKMLSFNSLPREITQPLDWQDTTIPQIWMIDGEVVRYHWYGTRGVRVSYDETPLSENDD
ncbi:MAG: alpha-galactosidase [Clostridia bacterium]|nr:alpha-galactosidase [Clostridia bacterium]